MCPLRIDMSINLVTHEEVCVDPYTHYPLTIKKHVPTRN
jgi:hypothetical protein